MSKVIVKKPRLSTHPFGDPFYRRLADLLMSKEKNAAEELGKCCKEVSDYQKEHPEENLCDSGDEMSLDSASKGSSNLLKKGFAASQAERFRIIKMDSLPVVEKSNPLLKKDKKAKQSSSTSLAPVERKKSDLSEDSEEEGDKKCLKCSESSSSSSNNLLECNECHGFVHMRCNRPEVLREQARDPRFYFTCTECTVANSGRRSRPNSPKPSKIERSGSTNIRPSDLSASLAEFKRKKMKTLPKNK